MNKIFTTFRLENSLKNILIFFPFLLSEKNFFSTTLIDLSLGFLVFTFVTSICYATNDYTDKKKDKINKLKSTKKILDKNKIVFLNIVLFGALFLLYHYSNFDINV